jgi:hypothetical protein
MRKINLLLLTLLLFLGSQAKFNEKKPLPVKTEKKTSLPAKKLSAPQCTPTIKKEITFYWDPVTNLVDTILYYKIFYRHPEDVTWQTFNKKKYDSISVPMCSVKVARSDIDTNDKNSVFYFGVIAVTMDGVASDTASSIDPAVAANHLGWCLSWMGSGKIVTKPSRLSQEHP